MSPDQKYRSTIGKAAQSGRGHPSETPRASPGGVFPVPFLSWFVLLLSSALKALFTIRADGSPQRWLHEQISVQEVCTGRGGEADAGRTPGQLRLASGWTHQTPMESHCPVSQNRKALKTKQRLFSKMSKFLTCWDFFFKVHLLAEI